MSNWREMENFFETEQTFLEKNALKAMLAKKKCQKLASIKEENEENQLSKNMCLNLILDKKLASIKEENEDQLSTNMCLNFIVEEIRDSALYFLK